MSIGGYKQILVRIALIGLSFWLPFPMHGQNSSYTVISAIDTIFAAQAGKAIPGYAVAVIQKGKIIHSKGYGMASIENNISIDTNTVFSIASLTKQFTAFLILELVEQAKLSLEDFILKYLPHLPACMNQVKLKHLLHHTSGIRDYFQLLKTAGFRWDDNYTNEDVIRLLRKQQTLNFAPGSSIVYSNSNYVLLAEIIEKVTKKQIRAYAQERIFTPLHMHHTSYQENIPVSNRALAYSLNEQGQLINQYVSNQTTGNTGMLSTAGDLAKWIANFTSHKIGTKALFEQLFALTQLDNGEKSSISAGTFTYLPYKGLPRLMNNGNYPGYRSQLFFFPAQQVGIIVLSNYGAQASVYEKATRIADIVLAEAMKTVKVPAMAYPKIKIDTKILASYAGRYQMGYDWEYEIKLEHNHLMLYEDSATGYPMIPLSENRFMVNAEGYYGRPFEFKVDQVDQQLYLHFGAENRGRRMAAQMHTTFNPKEYIGKYYSPELETTYTILVEENHLKATHIRNPSLTLKPHQKDSFTTGEWWFGHATFGRNKQGGIKSFTLEGDGFRELVFYKTDDPLE